MAEYDFNKDIDVGESGEGIVIRDLESIGLKLLSDNKDNKHDLLMDKSGEQITYEVKTDVLTRPESDTTNMFVEFECRGNPSGIDTSKAEWFVTYFKHFRELWYIKTDELTTLLNDIDCKVIDQAGDGGSNTKGYLLPRYQYKDNFIVRKIPKTWVN
jgi:hypothetical protein